MMFKPERASSIIDLNVLQGFPFLMTKDKALTLCEVMRTGETKRDELETKVHEKMKNFTFKNGKPKRMLIECDFKYRSQIFTVQISGAIDENNNLTF